LKEKKYIDRKNELEKYLSESNVNDVINLILLFGGNKIFLDFSF